MYDLKIKVNSKEESEEAQKLFFELDFYLNNLDFSGGGSPMESMYEKLDSIELALLKYRRENNIFEVGDLVVIKANPFWPEDYLIEKVEQKHIGKWYMNAWRHATDEEIKAGHRL